MRLRPLEPSDLDVALVQIATSFGRALDDALAERTRTRLGEGQLWGLEEDGVLAGHCRLLPSAHWLGGRAVPSLDVAALAVPPEHRGRGVASAMMREAVAVGRARGDGLSVLYPSTTRLYRRLGWEHAGSLTRYRVPARVVPTPGPTPRRGDEPTDWPAIRDCHAAFAATLQGAAVRSEERWAELAGLAHRYVLDDPDAPGRLEAYAVVEHEPIPGSWQHTLRLADWAATTPRGLAALATLAGSHGTFARDVVLVDVAPPRWAAVLDEQDLAATGGLAWMARGVDLPAAVAHRGFPAGLALAVTLRVDDDLAPSGPWRLEVADGRGTLSGAPGADVRLGPRAVGPLLTGFRAASELAALGLLRGPAEALALLDAAFAGPPPVMLDFF
ncbi:MAG: GNAT family N-acetyltransferase [Actinomycetota bacterium]